MKPKNDPLTPLNGSYHCTFSVIENKLVILYENQEKIYALMQDILTAIEKEKQT